MYREEYWAEGHYIDNHQKYECCNCDREFIVGEQLLKESKREEPICPYCGQESVLKISWTDDDELNNLTSEMGCLAIYVSLEV